MESRLLTENQARHLRVHFTSLIAEATALAEWARGLPAAESAWASEVEAELEALASSVRAAAADLGLDLVEREVDPRRRVASWASISWADILECRPESLRGYGPVRPGLGGALGPAVDEIAARLRRIGSLAERPGRDRGGD